MFSDPALPGTVPAIPSDLLRELLHEMSSLSQRTALLAETSRHGEVPVDPAETLHAETLRIAAFLSDLCGWLDALDPAESYSPARVAAQVVERVQRTEGSTPVVLETDGIDPLEARGPAALFEWVLSLLIRRARERTVLPVRVCLRPVLQHGRSGFQLSVRSAAVRGTEPLPDCARWLVQRLQGVVQDTAAGDTRIWLPLWTLG